MKNKICLTFLLSLILTGGSLMAQSILMRIPDSTVVAGNNIDIPIYADNTLTGRGVYSYTLQIGFSQTYLQVVSVITTGTLSNPFGSPAVNTSVPGMVTLAAAGTAPLTGSGKFIYIRFKALQSGYITISFTGSQNNYFNEGTPAMSFDNGNLSITSPPVITISPNSATIAKGEQVQFSQSGGTSPFQWFVTNPAIASINGSGLMTATGFGLTKAVVQDINGTRDTTNGNIDIRAMRLSIPTNLTQWQGADIDIPINTTDLTGLGILSGNLTLSFNSNILTPLGVVQTGTLLSTYPAPVINTGLPGYVYVAFAGTTPLTGSGTLLYIRFHVSATNSGSSVLNFVNADFNESFVPVFTNGSFSAINLPVLYITPASGTLVAGQTQQFTVNGGASPPLQWSISNSSVGSVNSSGLLATTTGGNTTISVTDSHGATATSGNWLIYDTQIFMPENTICPAAGTYYYPINISSLPAGQSVYSFQGKVTYNSSLLTFLQVETTGSLTQGWTFVSNSTSGNVIFSGSGINSFNSPGTIVFLKFSLNAGFVVGSNASLQLSNVTLNEGVPNPLVDVNGSITGTNPASASVSIAAFPSNSICSGTSVSFVATPLNGGTPTYQWKKNGSVISGAVNSTYTTNTLITGDIITCVLTPTGVCASGSPATSNAITMTVSPLPSAAGSISGPVLVAPGQSGLVYSIAPVANATSYSWSLPSGWSITAGSGTNSITATAGTFGGSIVVTPLNSCGNGTSSSLTVNLSGNKTLTLTLMLEGLFNTLSNQMNKAQNETGNQFPGSVADKITVELRQGSPPYALVQSYSNSDLTTNGSCTVSVSSGYSGSYYLVIKHRNSIETWSANPVSFAGSSIAYDFTTAINKAYGNNLKPLGTKYCIYGGDENQDGLVDSSDMIDVDNDVSVFAAGYLSTDINGDGLVDSTDMILVDNNANLFIGAITP